MVHGLKKFCEEYGVTLKVKREVHGTDDGTIFYQSREEGYTVISGTTLTIKISDSSSNGDEEDLCNEELEDCSELEDDPSESLE